MQTRKAILIFAMISKCLKIAALLAVTIYVILSILDRIYPEKFYRCEKYTKLLNGGERSFAGRKLNVILCGTGPDKNWMNDKIRLQVFSEEHTLLAQRTFHVDWDTNADRELVYSDDRLTYFDSSRNDHYIRSIDMPPTWWDWIRARTPLLN